MVNFHILQPLDIAILCNDSIRFKLYVKFINLTFAFVKSAVPPKWLDRVRVKHYSLYQADLFIVDKRYTTFKRQHLRITNSLVWQAYLLNVATLYTFET